MKNSVVCRFLLLSTWSLLSQAPLGAQAVQPEQRSAQPSSTPPRAEIVGAKALSTTLLGPDDQIMIYAVDVPEISNTPLRIDPNGDLRLPLIGRVHAAGMTVEDLERDLIERLKAYLREPDITIGVTDLRSQPVSILGAVGTAGVRQLEGRKTLVEVLSTAGGLSADAGPTVRITRRLDQGRIPLPEATEDPSGRFSTVEIDVKPLLEGRNPDKNIVIRPNDVISVPRADIVYVVGEVGKPGPVALTSGHTISVIEAVSASGGVLRTAASDHARLLRRLPGEQKRRDLNVNLSQIMRGKADDMPLLAGDILFVPDSGSKRIAARAIEAVIQTGILIGSYGAIR
jgi:polysaccharide export outer membrane protein